MTDASTNWKRLRLKIGTGDDPDWRGTQTTPNYLTAEVGGTTTAGDYTITLVGKIYTRTGGALDVNFTASFTRAAETDAQIATGLVADFTTGTINAGSPVLLSTVGITASVDTATITIVFPPNCDITASSTDPGSASITWALGQIMPITGSAPHYARAGASSVNGVVVQVSAMDDAGETLLDPEDGGTDQTFVIEALEVCTVERVVNGVTQYQQRIASIETIAAAQLNTQYILQLRGAKYWTVRLLTFAENIANVDSYEVAYRDASS